MELRVQHIHAQSTPYFMFPFPWDLIPSPIYGRGCPGGAGEGAPHSRHPTSRECQHPHPPFGHLLPKGEGKDQKLSNT